MRSPRCPCVNVSLYPRLNLESRSCPLYITSGSTAEKTPVSQLSLCVCVCSHPTVAMQRLGKYIPAAIHTHATIE
jgi:hypothetical protein